MTEIAERVVRALEAGLVVGLPTDTVYGIGADPWQEAAIDRLFAIKGRPGNLPIPILATDLAAVEEVAVVAETARRAAQRYWPGPLTLVLPRRRGLPRWLGDTERDTIGVRIPDHPAALGLLARVGPLAVTSANRSGEAPARDEAGAAAALGDAVAVYLPGVAGGGRASTVVDVSASPPRVIRPGPIEWEDE
jgi:tRNA threonylcarbamoyl adenosine modification protein (Sua5/YciO/YrdC/YwlC family)